MTRRSKLLLSLAMVFNAGNLGSGIVALAQGEPRHAGAHFALLVLGGFWALRLWRRDEQKEEPVLDGVVDDRLSSLERALDAVAIEVERAGEGQRFMNKLFDEREARRAAESVEKGKV